ncbi:MAG TPA: hypothetical protein VHB21_26290, partial [Minicystis sp.]|nr:hypothetical protein [Minicystis sp.]
GNVGNAVWHVATGDAGHQSIGASTAVFGAIGILAVTQVAVERKAYVRASSPSWLDIAGPIVGGFALLGALGAGGGNTDLGAHFFGLVAGGLVGGVAALALRRSGAVARYALDARSRMATEHVALGDGGPNLVAQAALGALAAVVVGLSWALAMRR